MFGRGLLIWGSYYHPLLPPLYIQLSFYVYFMLFITSLPVLISLIWQCVVIFISGLFIFTSPTFRNTRRHRPRPPWKRATIWRRRALTYWMVCHCCHRPKHCPPQMGEYFYPLPRRTTYWHCSKRRVIARTFCHWLAKFWGGHKNTPVKDYFAITIPLPCLQEIFIKIIRIYFAAMIIVTSYNCRD